MAWRPTFLTQRLERGLSGLALLSSRHPARALVAIGAICAATLLYAGKLPINADLADLLPGSFQSVQDLEIVKERLQPLVILEIPKNLGEKHLFGFYVFISKT